METRSPTNEKNQSILAEGEQPAVEWIGKVVNGDKEYPAQFVATDDRLVYSIGQGHFKDISFNHIQSVEVGSEINEKRSGIDPTSLLILSSVGMVIGLMIATMGDSLAGGGLVMILSIGTALFTFSEWSTLEDKLEILEIEVHHILVRTGENSLLAQPLYLKTEEDIGPELSRLVQEYRNVG